MNLPPPRKKPIQARSETTVSAILDAAIHILEDGGLDRFTTTRVALRAGASVGSLYQYFHNRESLLATVLERHLLRVVEAVEAECHAARGAPVAAMAHRIVDAFLDAKLADVAASRALYAVSSNLGSAALVAQLMLRSQRAVCDMLATASDARFADISIVGFVVSTSLVAPLQAALTAASAVPHGPAFPDELRNQLRLLVAGYLTAASMPG